MERIDNNIELVFLHIPKTAGTSFSNILKQVYGSKSVARIDINKNEIIINENQSLNHKILKRKIKVVHGHFSYKKLFESFVLSNDIPVVTWLRDPVERVISNYFYLKEKMLEKLNDKNGDFGFGNRMIKTIEEFALFERNQNRMSKFLKGADISKMFYVGLVEDFETDLQELAKKLNWEKYQQIKVNESNSKSFDIDEDTKDLIRKCNPEDVELYEMAKKLKNRV
jgi:hypothetical protein